MYAFFFPLRGPLRENGVCSSGSWKGRTWQEWRVSRMQGSRFLPKTLFVCPENERSTESISLLKFRRVTIRGAQPSARLSEEVCLWEGSAGVSPRALRGLSEGSAGSLRGGPRDFPRVFGGSDPMLVTLGNCWNLCFFRAQGQRKYFEYTLEVL